MAYFNHAFNKTFVVSSVAGANVATSALTAGQLGLVNGNAWSTVAAGGGIPVIPEGALAYLVQGSFYSKDTIGNNPGHGGYKESVKSKGINPRYLTELWEGNCSVASKATAKLCLASDCAPCGKTQFLRIDVKGSPALRFLNHNAYAIADSGGICCVDGQEFLDPALVLGTMVEMAIGNGLAKDNIKYAAGDPLITPFVAEGDPDGVKTFTAIAAGGAGTGYAVSASALATTAVSPGVGAGLTVQVTAIKAAVTTFGSLVGGTGYTGATGVATTVAPAGGSGATITTVTGGGAGTPVTAATLVAGGAGYSVGDVLTITGGGANATVTVTAIAATGAISAVTVLNEGAAYAVGDDVTVVGGNNDAVLDIASVSAGSVEVTSTSAAGVVTTEYYTVAQAVGKAASGNYVPSTDPNGADKVSACVTLQGAYVDTVFGNCSFDTRDHYNAEPVEIILSSLDETGNPCNDCGVASRTPGSMQQTQGEEVIRQLIMSERYRQSPYNQGNADSARFREIEMSDELLAAVDRTATYRSYYLKHSVPRFNNPSGVFDNDQYVYKVYIKCSDAALKTSMDNVWESIHKWAEANYNIVPVQTNAYW
tara:strand:- start:4440 stop:6224 length:1785 start_codon:yes stop_codon:yes gene_type:complete